MAEDQVKIRFVTEGERQAATGSEAVANGLTGVATAGQAAGAGARTASEGTRAFAQTAQTGAQRVQGMASAVQTLTSALGSRDRTAGLVASIAGGTAQFAAMGSMLGPGGALVGGLVGLAAGLAGTATAARDMARELEIGTRHVRSLVGEMDRVAMFDAFADGTASARDYAAEVDRLNGVLEANRVEVSRAEAGLSDLSATAIRALRDEALSLRATRDAVIDMAEIGERMRASHERMDEASADVATRTPTARGGGGRRTPAADPLAEARAAAQVARLAELQTTLDEIAELENSAMEAAAVAEREARRERETRIAEAAEREFDLRAEMAEAAADAELEQQERIAEGYLAMKTAQEEADRSALEGREQMAQELTAMLGDVTMTLGKTVASIAMGEKTAGEAFDGLAAAFLEMISQYTTLKAGVEFAEAGAAFARYDYAGGAAHIAVGAAFTAVAVATGAGAAAIGAPPATPASPESSAAPTEKRGGDTVINWNSPVVTASTEAGLGREIRGMLAAAGGI